MRSLLNPLLLGAACCLTASAASAQTVTAGVKGGAVLSSLPHAGEVIDQISERKSIDINTKLGATAGGFVEFAFTDRFSFQPEYLFVMKGVNLALDRNEGKVKVGINYLEFPLLLRVNKPLNGPLKGYIVVGPTISVKWSTKSTVDIAGDTEIIDIDPAFGSRDFGLVFGGGLERDRYLIEARYNLGLIDVPTGIYDHDNSIMNRAFSVMVGLRLP